jgi:probable rRNA maturation factor
MLGIKSADKIKEAVLGKEYDLSFSFIGPKKMRELNRTHRSKDYATDILSFELEKNAGEIFICKSAAAKKAKLFGRTPSNYLSFLFIHGLCHLKGMAHGATMERQERKIRKLFGI